MRAIRYAAASDTGRKRIRNEDAHVCRPPIFVVADGMGGARGGELAAGIATDVFDRLPGAGALDAVTQLRALVLEANRLVYERASAEPDLSGMGTTLTAAVLDGDRVAIAHVGDSRAYRLRGDRLEQLTDDHSLVGELVRSGRLTQEEADHHPQRSVITRAIGTDPTVLADVFLAEARRGDVFLLCSDGLTSMLDAEAIVRLLAGGRVSSDSAGALVRAANDAGGDDNITVVLFEIGAAEPGASTIAEPTSEERTLLGLGAEPTTDEQTLLRAPPRSPLSPAPPRTAAPARSRRVVLLAGLILLVLAAAAVAVVVGLRRAHFVGATADGHVAVYEGLPWELGRGIDLYREIYVSPVRIVQLSVEERRALFDHSLSSETRARERLVRFEQEIAIR